ncbi:hypothetical protein [Mitsuaria sp. 7]|uniref:hypothetical protein n=1 Tax=Mitsuaria sp. 7 TaxID=1658665 RepID=UPI0012FAC38C|nr:hypothetical protein [Mitsuaria sp. 7]
MDEDSRPLEDTLSVYWMDYLVVPFAPDRPIQLEALRSYLKDGHTGFQEMKPGATWAFAVLETDRLIEATAPAGAIEFRVSPRADESDRSICVRIDGGFELVNGAELSALGLVDPHASVNSIPHAAPLEWAVCHFLAERVMSAWEPFGPKRAKPGTPWPIAGTAAA